MENLQLLIMLGAVIGTVYMMLKFQTQGIKDLNKRIDKVEENHQLRYERLEDKIEKLHELVYFQK